VIENRGSTIVAAPVDRVYELFTYFHHYPEFMRHVKGVSYYDDQNTHWAVDVAGRHEWDAINEGWQRNSRIGWRATGGLRNSGEVLFQSLGSEATCVFVRLKYDPPGGAAGRFAAVVGGGRVVERALQQDLDRFAEVIGESRSDGETLDWNTIRRRRLYTIRGTIERARVIPLRPT
jgi:uncharacterized membrane protein